MALLEKVTGWFSGDPNKEKEELENSELKEAGVFATHLLPAGIGDLAGAALTSSAVSDDVEERGQKLLKNHPGLAQVLARQLNIPLEAVTPQMLAGMPGVFQHMDERTADDADNSWWSYAVGGGAALAGMAFIPLSIPLIPFAGPMIAGAGCGLAGTMAYNRFSEHPEDKYCKDTLMAMSEALDAWPQAGEKDRFVIAQTMLLLRTSRFTQERFEKEELSGASIESALLAYMEGGNPKLVRKFTRALSEPLNDQLIRDEIDPLGMPIVDALNTPQSLAAAYMNAGLTLEEIAVGQLDESFVAAQQRRMAAPVNNFATRDVLSDGRILAQHMQAAQSLPAGGMPAFSPSDKLLGF